MFERQILSRTTGFLDGERYWVYALTARGKPFYVGETMFPRARFKNHLKEAYGGRDTKHNLTRYLGMDGQRIWMHALENTSSRIKAWAQEAAWAQAFSACGFKLENGWPEHRANSRCKLVPENRLLRLSIHEATLERISFRCNCRCCGQSFDLPVAALKDLSIGNPTILSIQGCLSCAGCKGPVNLNPVLPDEAQNQRIIAVPDATTIAAFLGSLKA